MTIYRQFHMLHQQVMITVLNTICLKNKDLSNVTVVGHLMIIVKWMTKREIYPEMIYLTINILEQTIKIVHL